MIEFVHLSFHHVFSDVGGASVLESAENNDCVSIRFERSTTPDGNSAVGMSVPAQSFRERGMPVSQRASEQ